MKMIEFTATLKKIENQKEKYEIIIDHDYLRIQPKEDFEEELETYYFNTTPSEILWKILTEQGFEVSEG